MILCTSSDLASSSAFRFMAAGKQNGKKQIIEDALDYLHSTTMLCCLWREKTVEESPVSCLVSECSF